MSHVYYNTQGRRAKDFGLSHRRSKTIYQYNFELVKPIIKDEAEKPESYLNTQDNVMSLLHI